MRVLAAVALCFSLWPTRSFADDYAELTASGGGVVDADATTKDAAHYRFRGTTTGATLLLPRAKPNQWLGISTAYTYLVNTYTKNGAAESLRIRDYGFLWQLANPTMVFGLSAGLGVSQADVVQTSPAKVTYAYKSGWVFNGAARFGLIGNVDANLHLRVEANYRTFSSGIQSGSDQKGLPLKIISYPVCVGASLRL